MGFFDFLKPKKNEIIDTAQSILKQVFPKGEEDYKAGTLELLDILNSKVSESDARNIFIKSTLICRVVSSKNDENIKFDKERLKVHLSGYCLEYFNDEQITRLHNYQIAMLTASLFGGSPKEVKRNGNGYSW